MFTPTCPRSTPDQKKTLAAKPRRCRSHCTYNRFLINRAATRQSAGWIMLRGLQPRLPRTTTDALFVAPPAVSRKNVPFWRALCRKRQLQAWENADQLCGLPELMPEVPHPNESSLPCQTAHTAIFLSLPQHWHVPQQTVQRLLHDPINLAHCQDPHQEHDPLHNAVGKLDVTAARVPKWLLS